MHGEAFSFRCITVKRGGFKIVIEPLWDAATYLYRIQEVSIRKHNAASSLKYLRDAAIFDRIFGAEEGAGGDGDERRAQAFLTLRSRSDRHLPLSRFCHSFGQLSQFDNLKLTAARL